MVIHYEKSIIYKLCCKDPLINEIYIGSTTCFTRRKNKHKSSCTNKDDKSYNIYVYNFIRKNGDWSNWDIVQVESYNAKNKRDLETRERYWIDELKSALNKQKPTQTKAEWYQVNKEKNYEKVVKYRTENKESIDKYQAEYRLNNKEKASDYYQNNKEKASEKKSIEKVICECGSEVRKCGLTRHKKSDKHIQFLKKVI